MKFTEWGTVAYKESMAQQLELVDAVRAHPEAEQIIFCSHPPVVTLGRGSKESDVFGWKGEIVEASRGGRATYHGPNQLVIYPILDLSSQLRKSFKPKDIHSYLRSLESSVVEGLKLLGLASESRTSEYLSEKGEMLSVTGVWVGEKKLASIGIAVKSWVSYHGVAINCEKDETAFQGINPCGFKASMLTSIEEALGEKPNREQVTQAMKMAITNNLN